MKIGLIGINRYAKFLNFACDLHVYAFQEFLGQHGYESTILDYKPVQFGDFDMRHPAPYAEARYRDAVVRKATTPEQIEAREKDLQKWAALAVGYRSAWVERERRYDKFEAFIDRHLTFTDEVYDSDLLEVEDPGLDAYMCVTDVIWQSVPKHHFDRGFLLGSKAFEGKPKIAYAASRGAAQDYSDEDAAYFFDYLSDMDAISVRERDFGEYIENNSPYSAPTVLDPTLLHDGDFWSKVSTKPREEKYVLLYYVMESSADTIQKAVEYAKLHDLTLVELSDRPFKHGKVSDPDVKHISRYDVGMEEWLGYIEHAEAVFTNSFHGCCFSLLFEKTFFVGARNGQKVPNFLATFGLTDRRFARNTDVRALDHEIDYAPVREILRERRAQSADFVLGALDAAKKRIEAGEIKDHSVYEARRRALTYPLRFHSNYMGKPTSIAESADAGQLTAKKLRFGALEYGLPQTTYRNDGATAIPENRFVVAERDFAGWTLRFRIDNRWFWYLQDDTIAEGDLLGAALDGRKKIFADGAALPHLPVNHVTVGVLVAQWYEQGTTTLAAVDRSARAAATSARLPATPKAHSATSVAEPMASSAPRRSFLQRVVRKLRRMMSGKA